MGHEFRATLANHGNLGPDLKAFNLLADAALRAGVVIPTLNMTGLKPPFLEPGWSTIDAGTFNEPVSPGQAVEPGD